MAEGFLKSSLPSQGPGVPGDTSLALEQTAECGTGAEAGHRSLRVQRQVQLTLSRKSQKAPSNGGVHLKPEKSLDDSFLSNTKLNGSDFSSRSLTGHVPRLSRRFQVSTPQNSVFSRSHLDQSVYLSGTHTHPQRGHLHTAGTLQDHSRLAVSFRTPTIRVVPSERRKQASRSADATFRRSQSLRAMQPASAAAAFPQNGPTSRNQQTVLDPNKRFVRRRNNKVFEYTQTCSAPSWPALVNRDAQKSLTLKSYPASSSSAEVKIRSQVKAELPVGQAQNVAVLPQMTMEEAVDLLKQDNEETLILALNYIQRQCFQSYEAREKVFSLHAIEILLYVLNNESEDVQRMAAGALRNVVYQNQDNKMEVESKDGLSIISTALVKSYDKDTGRQLTGLLWNLSANDILKERFKPDVIDALTKSVLVPTSGMSEGENPKDKLRADDDAFYHATGCLRNLSSAGPNIRQMIRNCENLIDSLVYYVQGTVASLKADDRSTENCVCILHNMTFQVEEDYLRQYIQQHTVSNQNLASESTSVGCFPYRSAKISKDLQHEHHQLENKSSPKGVEWLWSPISVRMFLSVMACSKILDTRLAAIGALQNITAGQQAMSKAMAMAIVKQEKGLELVKEILMGGVDQEVATTIRLIRNLSNHQETYHAIGDILLPKVVEMLPIDDKNTLFSEATSFFYILLNLIQRDKQYIKPLISNNSLTEIIRFANLYEGCGRINSVQVACVLLHKMWDYTDFHETFRTKNTKKSDFINPTTAKAVKEFYDKNRRYKKH
ncbi:plakophilin-2 [Menidia menidia]